MVCSNCCGVAHSTQCVGISDIFARSDQSVNATAFQCTIGDMVKSLLKAVLRWPKLATTLTAGAMWVAGYFGLDLPAEELSGAIGGAVALVAALAFAKKKLPPKEE